MGLLALVLMWATGTGLIPVCVSGAKIDRVCNNLVTL